MEKISAAARQLKPSATILLAAKVREMVSRGEDVVSFTIGEPDFDTPERIKAHAVKALKDGFTKYTPAAGIKELREAIAGKLGKENSVEMEPENTIATSGGKQALSLLFQAMCDEGDEVIIPAPYWVSYLEQVKLARAVPVILDTDEDSGFKITPDGLKSRITPRTKALILNSPSNPTGAVYERSELEAVAEAALKSGMWVVSDEVYETIVYDGREHVSIASLGREIKERTIIINSFSKTYSMPGWRIGYAAGDRDIIKAMINIQSQTTSHPDSIAQKAAVGALTGPQDEVQEMRREFEARRDIITGLLEELGIPCFKPQGAFYAFANVGKFYGKPFGKGAPNGSSDIADILLDEAKVAVVPGVEFGSDSNVRISYAVSRERIKEGIERIGELVCPAKG